MAETLSVRLNRDGPHAVESQSTFETDGSFSLVLENDGTPEHVHLRPRGDLADAVRVGTSNPYVEDRTTVEVEAREDRPEEVTGGLEVVTGYGAESTSVAVTLTTPDRVIVDESLGEPATTDTGGEVDRRTAAVGVLVALVVVLAGVLAATSGDALAVMLGGLAVLAAAGTALYLGQSD